MAKKRSKRSVIVSPPPDNRRTFCYVYAWGEDGCHFGITNNPARREREHQKANPGGKLVVLVSNVTRDLAKAWEREQQRLGRPIYGYKR